MRKQDRDWVRRGSFPGENGGNVISPELEAESADGRRRDCVGDAGELDIKSADGEIGGTCGAWDEGL